jgi:hypothetical protein
MIREAELFVMAEQVLVEVVGRIRGEQWDIVLPPLLDGPGAGPTSIREAVTRSARDDARLPDLLAGAAEDGSDRFGGDLLDGDLLDGDLLGGDPLGGDLLGDDAHAAVRTYSAAACAAAREVTDGDAEVHSSFGGDVPTRDYLSQLTITRSLLAHEIAMHLGSRACPLTEELARGLWEGTEPRAEYWRSIGFFREPMPMPMDVSWRDRFLLSSGRDPHALEDRV